MTASEGSIIGGLSQVIDHGPATLRWNLVVLGDGYTILELPKFHQDVENFIACMRSTPPFDMMWNAINVFRLDVSSDESGADISPQCGGTAVSVRTFYDARFCNRWNMV